MKVVFTIISLFSLVLGGCSTVNPDPISLTGPLIQKKTLAQIVNSDQQILTTSPILPESTAFTDFKPNERYYLTPTIITKVPFVIKDGNLQNVYWQSLSDSEIKSELALVHENTEVFQKTTDGKFEILANKATAKKGVYNTVYYYYVFKNYSCGGLADGVVAVGVGMRVIAGVKTTKANVDVSNLIPLAVSVDQNDLSGQLSVEGIGLTSANGNISSYLSSAGTLNEENIRKAVESFGIVKAVLGTTQLKLTPHALWIMAPDANKCSSVLEKFQ